MLLGVKFIYIIRVIVLQILRLPRRDCTLPGVSHPTAIRSDIVKHCSWAARFGAAGYPTFLSFFRPNVDICLAFEWWKEEKFVKLSCTYCKWSTFWWNHTLFYMSSFLAPFLVWFLKKWLKKPKDGARQAIWYWLIQTYCAMLTLNIEMFLLPLVPRAVAHTSVFTWPLFTPGLWFLLSPDENCQVTKELANQKVYVSAMYSWT